MSKAGIIYFLFFLTFQDFSQREIRKNVHFSTKKFKFDLQGGERSKLFFFKNRSENGLGCLTFGSQFLGRGCTITSNQGVDYIIRWVKVRFGFFYEFGLEKLA